MKQGYSPGRFTVLLACMVLLGGCADTGPTTPAVTPALPVVTVTGPQTPEPTSAGAPAAVTGTGTVTGSPTPRIISTPAPSPGTAGREEPVPEAVLQSRIQDARNKLSLYKDSNVADTIVAVAGSCEVKQSKELGYLIDVHTGDMYPVKGEYGSIRASLFEQHMVRGHTYIILHSHARDWYTCDGEHSITLDTFSLGDLSAASFLTRQGYHIRTIIAVSDRIYEVSPVTEDGWKTPGEVLAAVERIEQRMEMSFHTDFNNARYYDVDNLMPLLTRDLGYVYTVDQDVVVH